MSLLEIIFVIISQETVEVVKKFMAREPENVNFNVMALAKGSLED